MEETESSASGSASTSRSSRSVTSRPLIGQMRPELPVGKLPTGEDILRLVAYYRSQPKCQKKSLASFCCLRNHEKESICFQGEGCGERADPCLFLKVKLPWLQAGFRTVSDTRIKEKLGDLVEEYSKVFGHRNVKTSKVEETREDFVLKMKKAWDIKHPNARQTIIEDENSTD
jgi:hypothetical protein